MHTWLLSFFFLSFHFNVADSPFPSKIHIRDFSRENAYYFFLPWRNKNQSREDGSSLRCCGAEPASVGDPPAGEAGLRTSRWERGGGSTRLRRAERGLRVPAAALRAPSSALWFSCPLSPMRNGRAAEAARVSLRARVPARGRVCARARVRSASRNLRPGPQNNKHLPGPHPPAPQS